MSYDLHKKHFHSSAKEVPLQFNQYNYNISFNNYQNITLNTQRPHLCGPKGAGYMKSSFEGFSFMLSEFQIHKFFMLAARHLSIFSCSPPVAVVIVIVVLLVLLGLQHLNLVWRAPKIPDTITPRTRTVGSIWAHSSCCFNWAFFDVIIKIKGRINWRIEGSCLTTLTSRCFSHLFLLTTSFFCPSHFLFALPQVAKQSRTLTWTNLDYVHKR